MTSSLRRTLNKIRITVLWVLVGMNFMSALIITLAIDSIPLSAWPVWLTFLANILFLMLMAYANGWMYGTELWWEREVMEKGYTCTDCIHKNRCMERSRNYCCICFKPRREGREDVDGQRKGPGKQSQRLLER
jgi:hypothetical protein